LNLSFFTFVLSALALMQNIGEIAVRRSGLQLLTIGVMLHTFVLFTSAEADNLPQQVKFQSLDGNTMLTGYLFRPAGKTARQIPAIVMMHGRAGAYSSLAKGKYDASTLSKRHAFWGHFWASHGYAALLVDGFGPRGYAGGFPIHSYDARPDLLNEVTVRPLDAYGALKYLRSRSDIDGDRVALQGWSNGGSATIAAMSDEILAAAGFNPREGFRGAVAFYPACTMHDRFANGYHPYAPLRVFSGDADEEVSAERCARLVENSQASGGDVSIEVYRGATHDFDDPGAKRQRVPENAAAAERAIPAAFAFLKALFRR
jgi:dienelactone hydrolase